MTPGHACTVLVVEPLESVSAIVHRLIATETLENPFTLGVGAAELLAGTYGPRVVTAENGRLFYQRTGGRRFALVPASADLFMLEGNPAFRVQFVSESGSQPTKLVGWYHDGRRDETARTP